MSASPGSAPRDRRAGTTLAMLLVACGCSGGERASASSERPGEPSPPAPATGAPSSAGEPAAPPTAPSVPPTSIDLVDAAPLELDWPVVPASDAHDAVLPPGVLPDDFAIIVRPRIGAAPFVELRPRAGMSLPRLTRTALPVMRSVAKVSSPVGTAVRPMAISASAARLPKRPRTAVSSFSKRTGAPTL